MVTIVTRRYAPPMFWWGETDVLWTEGILALLRWRRERRSVAVAVASLVAETEAWLATGGAVPEPPASWDDFIL